MSTPELYVRAEMTPNPQTLRFVTNQVLTEQPTEFKKATDAVSAPLAKKIFGFPWTDSVYIGRDFVAVTKQDWVDWETLAEPLAGIIQEHLERGEVVMQPRAETGAGNADPSDSDDIRTIKMILDKEIRPAVAQDGGDIVFHKFDDGVVYLFMQGACAGCPSSTMTLKQGIETRLKEVVPSIREVVSM
jgi:Fe-S cluster biogenesis protein NfuA